MFHGNDRVTELLDGIYIGGIENNVERTLPHVTVWINYAHECRKERTIHERAKTNYLYFPFRFDDGDLYAGQEMWLKTFEKINEYRGERILISCSEGVSRSAVMCLWLLCEHFHDFDKAFDYLTSKRKIYIDKGFLPFVQYLQDVYSTNSFAVF